MKKLTKNKFLIIKKSKTKHNKEKKRKKTKQLIKRIDNLRRDSKRHLSRRSLINTKLAEMNSSALPIDRRKQVLVTVPSKFSIVESPETVLMLVGSFARSAVKERKIKSIFFDHYDLKTYDLAANSLLDIVASELDNQYTIKGTRLKLRCKGALPKDRLVRRFIRAIGIIKHLDIKHEAPSKQESTKLEVFDRRLKHYSPFVANRSVSQRDKVSQRFVDHINNCLANIDRELTEEGVTRLTEYLAEILNNAEEHSGFIDWTLQGYLDSSAPTPFCEIAIFNFGKSMADTLLGLPKTSYTMSQIQPYIDKHQGRRLFGTDWRPEDLLTVMALQPHVSSKNTCDTDTRGQGTVDLIQFFQTVSMECSDLNVNASMAILSGSTHILFDGTHKLSADPSGTTQVIAFNKNNDLLERPDKNYVRPLGDMKFPGTIISIRFPLSSDSLTEEVI